MTARYVRPTLEFYAQLHAILGEERGPRGEPSRVDFEFYDLIDILAEFMDGWDQLPRLFPERDDYRVLVQRGRLVYGYVVHGQLNDDGLIELVKLSIDLHGPQGPGPSEDDDQQ